ILRPLRSCAILLSRCFFSASTTIAIHPLSLHDALPISFSGAPSFRLTGWVLEHFRQKGGETVHLSITHDAGRTVTFVVVEGSGASIVPPVDQPAPLLPGSPEALAQLEEFRARARASRDARRAEREAARRTSTD